MCALRCFADQLPKRADRRDCARLPPVSWLLPAIGSADTTSVRSCRHWRPRLLGWPTGWDSRVHGWCLGRAPHRGIMWVTFGHLRPPGHTMPDHAGDRGAVFLVLAPHVWTLT